MKAVASLLRWASPTDPTRQAAEWKAAEGRSPWPGLLRTAEDLGSARFVVVHFDAAWAAGLHDAVESFHAAGHDARLCLAGDRNALEAVDMAGLDSDRVGLLLDGVDVDTPLSTLIWDRIEAVRFGHAFVAGAARDLRLGCALESMLGLSRDLGLCTLGWNVMPDGASLSGYGEFDYLPAPAAEPEAPGRRRSSSGRQIQFAVDAVDEHAQRR